MDLISEVYVSDTPPSDDVTLNLSEIARTKIKAMGEGDFGIDANPPWGVRLRWLVEVVDSPRDTPPADAPTPKTKTLRDEFAFEAMKKLMDTSGLKAAAHHDEATRIALGKLSYGIADAMMEARKK